MVKNHIKRINAPKRWEVLRKNHAFISRPNPGRAHDLCLSLNTVIKELLKKTRTSKESKYLIKKQRVFVNGKRRYDEKFPVGFLDVVSFPDLKEDYRCLVNKKAKIFLLKISNEDAKLKISKVINKKQASKDETQILCSDGRSFILKKENPFLKEIKTNDSLLYTLPDQTIKQAIKLEKGTLVYLYKGKHTGLLVAVDDFKGENIIFTEDKDVFETKKAYALAVGKDKPAINLAENENQVKKSNHKGK